MEKSICGLVKPFVFISIFICVQGIYAQNQRPDFSANPIKRIRMIVSQSYENCGPEEISLPVEDTAAKLLKYADVDVVLSDTEDYDAIMKIKIEGKAEGTYYYPAGYLYTGAYLSGKIILESKKIPICEKKFEVYINTPSSTNITWTPLRPCEAPFDRAFYLSDSVISKLLEIIYDAYGIDPVIYTLRDKNTDIQNIVIETLVNIGKPALCPLIATLHNDDLDIVKGSIETLGRMGDNLAVENIILALQKNDPGIRWKAAKALGRLRDNRAVEPLIAVLKDENKITRWYAAKSLGEIGDKRAVTPLMVLLKDEDPGVQYYAKEALKNIDVKNLSNRITEIDNKDQYQQ